MKTAFDTNSYYRKSTTSRFAEMTADELRELAAKWNADREMRGAQQVGDYRLDSRDGALVNIATGDVRHCEDVRRFPFLPGVVTFIGCDCEDERFRLAPLRKAMEAAGCGSPLHCKHHVVRMLLAGHTLLIAGKYRVRAKPELIRAGK